MNSLKDITEHTHRPSADEPGQGHYCLDCGKPIMLFANVWRTYTKLTSF